MSQQLFAFLPPHYLRQVMGYPLENAADLTNDQLNKDQTKKSPAG